MIVVERWRRKVSYCSFSRARMTTQRGGALWNTTTVAVRGDFNSYSASRVRKEVAEQLIGKSCRYRLPSIPKPPFLHQTQYLPLSQIARHLCAFGHTIRQTTGLLAPFRHPSHHACTLPSRLLPSKTYVLVLLDLLLDVQTPPELN
jgi:hypothetical protein